MLHLSIRTFKKFLNFSFFWDFLWKTGRVDWLPASFFTCQSKRGAGSLVVVVDSFPSYLFLINCSGKHDFTNSRYENDGYTSYFNGCIEKIHDRCFLQIKMNFIHARYLSYLRNIILYCKTVCKLILSRGTNYIILWIMYIHVNVWW